MNISKLLILMIATIVTHTTAQNTENADPYSVFGKTYILGEDTKKEKIFIIENFPGDSPVSRIEHYTESGMVRLFDKKGRQIGEKRLTRTERAFITPDPLAEKYYSISPYAFCGNNPLKYVDLRGDSLTLVGNNIQEILMAIYNGLKAGTNTTMKFNNGVLDPSSIADQAWSSNDEFLKDIYEISVSPMMVELSVSEKNTYRMNGMIVTEDFKAPYDFNTNEFPDAERLSKLKGDPIGYSIQGNLGQTLVPGNTSASGKEPTNSRIQVIINGKGTLNHRTVGMAHEFGHVILYMRGLPYGHRQPGVDDFVYGKATRMSKRLGYDY